jgi:hypothetical protein
VCALSPTIDPASGVNENIPFSARDGSSGRIRPSSGGSSRAASASAGSNADGVNGINDGCIAPPGGRRSCWAVAIGSW